MPDTHSDRSDSDRLNPDTSAEPAPPEAAASKARKISRRQFGRDAAIATAASLSAPALIVPVASPRELRAEGQSAQEKPKTPPAQQKPGAETKSAGAGPGAAQAKTEPLKRLTPKQVADVEAKLTNILRKHPSRFSDAQKKHLRRILAQQERLLAPVRAVRVENGDSPASVLRVLFNDVILPPTKKGSE
jgi:hypothetical protein